MTNKPLLLVVATLAICLGIDASADAASTILGTGAFHASSSTSNTGMLGTGTEFTINNLTGFTAPGTGIFFGPPALPEQTFGAVTFTPGSPTGFAIDRPAFGLFDATSITEVGGGSAEFRNWLIKGDWTPGNFAAFGRLTRGPKAASFTLAMSSLGSASISASGTFAAFAPSSVPEPSTLVMLLTGLAGAGFAGRKRRRPHDCH